MPSKKYKLQGVPGVFVTRRVFHHDETKRAAFNACYDAEKWLAAHGFVVGPMERGSPRGVMLSADFFCVEKWRNLSLRERSQLIGVMTGGGREQAAIVYFKAGVIS